MVIPEAASLVSVPVIVQPSHGKKLCKFIHFALLFDAAHSFVAGMCPGGDFFVSFSALYRINLPAP